MKTIPSQTGSEPAAVRRNLKDGYVKLISSDGHVFTLKREYVELSSTLMNMIEDGDTPLISAEMLKFLCVYLTVRHQMRDSWFDVEQHEHGSLIEISEKIVNGKVEPKITLNEATDYGIVRRSVLAKAGADPLKLLEAMQYYGLCTDLLPHERYWKHKDNDKRGAPFIAEDFHMIEFKTCTPTNVPQRFLGVELIVRVDEYAIESFRELMPNLHSKCRAGDKVPSLNDLCEREAKNWQVRMQNFINMCRALETRQFVKQARYECTQCSTGYGSKYPLANHFKKKHMTVESSDEEVEEAPPVKKPKRECPKHKCPVQSCTTSPSTEHLTRHLKSGLPGHGYTDDQVKTAKQQMGIRMKSSRKRLFED
ncbi:hypothetical protein M3Y97_00399600 [Aphelenchoides bicaudatus]|nr:hypothetical protein M3Y97_00399600 [Aphelenchoides bicaudatus]